MYIYDFYKSKDITSFKEQYTVYDSNKADFFRNICDNPNIQNILEIGFYGGHSTDIFLSTNRTAKMISFDIGIDPCVHFGQEYIQYKYPNRHRLILGDSRITLPEFIKNNNMLFDLILIDGGYIDDIPESDLLNCRILSHKDTIVIMNNTIKTIEYISIINIKPDKAWTKLKNLQYINEINTIEFSSTNCLSYGTYNRINLKDYFDLKQLYHFEGHTQQNESLTKLLSKLVNNENIINVMQIGFYAGHSAETFLSSNQNIHLTSFDLDNGDYTKIGQEYINTYFPDRHTLIIGDSLITIPEFIKKNKIKFDLIFIDGGRFDNIPEIDLLNCKFLSHKNTIIIMNDTISSEEYIKPWNVDPNKAWKKCKESGYITQLATYDFSSTHGLSYGNYFFVSIYDFFDFKGITHFEGNTRECDEKTELLKRLCSDKNIVNVMEIGFYAGHSAETFLSSNENIYLTSFEISDNEYTKIGQEYINLYYSGRHTLIIGDSRNTIPEFIKNKNMKFDLIFIDGGRFDNVPESDLDNCRYLSHENTIIIMNDTMNNQNYINPWNLKPNEAWNKFKNICYISELATYDFSSIHGLSYGVYKNMNIQRFYEYKNITSFKGNTQQSIDITHQLKKLCIDYSIINIMEIGFYAGHSADTFLSTNKNIKVTSFDLGDDNYLHYGKEYIDTYYPDRHTLILGDSRITIPDFFQKNNITFDLIFIDGGRFENLPEIDLHNSKYLSTKNTIIVMNDTMNNKDFINPWNIQPNEAWEKSKNIKVLNEIDTFDFPPIHGLSYGQFNYTSLSEFYQFNIITNFEKHSKKCVFTTELLEKLSSNENIKNILEIGFYAGHSSEIFLLANKKAKVTSFDLGDNYYTKIGKIYIDQYFPNRHTLILGDSFVTLPQYIKNNNIKFDLIFIDGNRYDKMPYADLLNCRVLSHEKTIVIMNDTMTNPKNINLWNIQPNKAWEESIKLNYIKQIHSHNFSPITGLSYGHYHLCQFFVLSLLKEDRLPIIEKNKKTIPQLQIIKSVNGYNKDETIRELIELKVKYKSLHYKSYGTLANSITKIKMLKYQIEKNIPFICFLEDDLLLKPEFELFIYNSICLLKDDINMIRLQEWGEGYITSVESAKRILEHIYRDGFVDSIDNQFRERCGKEIRVFDTPFDLTCEPNKGDCLKTEWLEENFKEIMEEYLR
jgi:predicted O-methyltransferase YrrM